MTRSNLATRDEPDIADGIDADALSATSDAIEAERELGKFSPVSNIIIRGVRVAIEVESR